MGCNDHITHIQSLRSKRHRGVRPQDETMQPYTKGAPGRRRSKGSTALQVRGELLAIAPGSTRMEGPGQNWTLNYDSFVIVTPVLTAVSLKEERDPPWSDARLACLHPNQFSAGSLVPPTPQQSGAPSWDRRQNPGLLWVCV